MDETKHSNFKFLPLGGIIQDFHVNGHSIVLGFETEELYKKYNTPYFGETIGRVANRISGAKINNLDGKSWLLAANNGPNTLHGGVNGWGKKTFEGPVPVNRHGKETVLFKYLSADGDEGFPGTVELRLWYGATVEPIAGSTQKQTVLEIEYEAELVGDEHGITETAISLTNHSYFNLNLEASKQSGQPPSIEGTEACLATNLHLVVNDEAIPTGKIERFPGITAGEPFILGAQQPAVDHCFVFEDNPQPQVPIDTRGLDLRKLAWFYHPATKLHLEVHSTEPSFQFYTGEFTDVSIDNKEIYGPRSGFCVEPARDVDAINQEGWRNMVVLKRGQKYGSRIVYRAWQS